MFFVVFSSTCSLPPPFFLSLQAPDKTRQDTIRLRQRRRPREENRNSNDEQRVFDKACAPPSPSCFVLTERSKMVVIHVKQGGGNEFLFETTCKESNDVLIRKMVRHTRFHDAHDHHHRYVLCVRILIPYPLPLPFGTRRR